MANFLEELYNKIKEAEKEAIKEGIEANTIFLNENFDKTKAFYNAISELYIGDDGCVGVLEYPPLILGKKVLLANFLPDKYSFALGKTTIKSATERIEELERDLDLIRKYVRLAGNGDNAQLVFKNVSVKKHTEDFYKLAKILML